MTTDVHALQPIAQAVSDSARQSMTAIAEQDAAIQSQMHQSVCATNHHVLSVENEMLRISSHHSCELQQLKTQNEQNFRQLRTSKQREVSNTMAQNI